jgi:hypothetical protein
MKITPFILEQMYLSFSCLHPLRNWDLPPPELIQFKVTREKDAMATYRYQEDLDKPHIITISRLKNEHLGTIQRSLVHEMVHLSFWKTGAWDKHGKAFKSRTKACAREFGWDSLEL